MKIDPNVAAAIADTPLPPIPVAPADLRRSCPNPPVAVGDDAMVLNRRYEVALQDCDRRRARAVAWSDQIARDYGPQGSMKEGQQ